MSEEQTRRRFLRATGAVGAVSWAGCSGGGETPTNESPFPAGSCLAATSERLPTPEYGFEFSSDVAPEVGASDATSAGDVTVSDGVATFGEDGGEIRVEDVPPVDDFTVSLFARPAVEATDQWNVALWYSPPDREWAGWGVEHGTGAVDFWVEGSKEASTEVLTTSSSPLPVDTWTHVVGVKRGAETTLYLDGERAATSELAFSDISYGDADTVDMYLGRHAGNGVGDRYYRGELDSVAVWSDSLSDSDIEALLSAGRSCR
jgi:hypothetical protein